MKYRIKVTNRDNALTTHVQYSRLGLIWSTIEEWGNSVQPIKFATVGRAREYIEKELAKSKPKITYSEVIQ